MPLAEFKDFDDCVRKTSRRKGFSSQGARKYCGVIKRDVEGSIFDEPDLYAWEDRPVEMLLVEASNVPFTPRLYPGFFKKYDDFGQELMDVGFRVVKEKDVPGTDEAVSVAWIRPLRDPGSGPQGDKLESYVRAIGKKYEDQIGPIKYSLVDDSFGFREDYDDGYDDDDSGGGGDNGTRPRGPRPPSGRSMKQPKTQVAAALNPDDWSYDFPTLLDALEFKQRLADSGPTGAQIANKLVFRKKRLRYVAYQLPQHELTYLKRFTGQDRGPWQKREPHDEVL